MSVLYGIGVGPGASDLITLRALETVRRANVLALPRSSDWGESTAWKILSSAFEPPVTQERLFLTFPMSKDPERLRPAWERALAQLGPRLAAGLSVAFVTEGDPSLYSTFVYLQREARARWPEVRVEVVPGVTSVTAVAGVLGVPLADGQERVAIIPATYGVGDLDAILAAFDTVVLMKLGGELPAIVAALERADLLDRAYYVSRASMQEQRIVRDLRDAPAGRGDCFAMVIVAKKQRDGVLLPKVAHAG